VLLAAESKALQAENTALSTEVGAVALLISEGGPLGACAAPYCDECDECDGYDECDE
jgi:hypothetical protein